MSSLVLVTSFDNVIPLPRQHFLLRLQIMNQYLLCFFVRNHSEKKKLCSNTSVNDWNIAVSLQ